MSTHLGTGSDNVLSCGPLNPSEPQSFTEGQSSASDKVNRESCRTVAHWSHSGGHRCWSGFNHCVAGEDGQTVLMWLMHWRTSQRDCRPKSWIRAQLLSLSSFLFTCKWWINTVSQSVYWTHRKIANELLLTDTIECNKNIMFFYVVLWNAPRCCDQWWQCSQQRQKHKQGLAVRSCNPNPTPNPTPTMHKDSVTLKRPFTRGQEAESLPHWTLIFCYGRGNYVDESHFSTALLRTGGSVTLKNEKSNQRGKLDYSKPGCFSPTGVQQADVSFLYSHQRLL